MKLLIVGDYHAESSDLADCQRLADYIVDLARKHTAVTLFTGDQYHTHAIIHAEVQKFWYDLYNRLPNGSISLVGNHDRPGSASSKATAMLAHYDQTKVVESPCVRDGILFLPYMHEREDFISTCNAYPLVKTLICHQTFDGSKYENGFYAQDGVNLNLIPQDSVISGHIHSPQEFGKLWYVGAPRWRTISDADIDRHIWLVDFDDEGRMISREGFSTANVCRMIIQIVDTEDKPYYAESLPDGNDYRVDVHGSAAYIEQRLPVWKALGARVRSFKKQETLVRVSESEGVDKAFSKWVGGFTAARGTSTATLQEMLKERVQRGI